MSDNTHKAIFLTNLDGSGTEYANTEGGGGASSANDVSFDNTTSGLPATEVQTAIDVIDAEVDDIVNVYGAKNLLKNELYAYGLPLTVNDITFNLSTDDSINMSGTASAATAIAITPYGYYVPFTGSYTLSGGDSTDLSLRIIDSNNVEIARAYGDDITVTLTVGEKYMIWLHVANGTVTTGRHFYPMLRLASIPDSTYEPYSMTNQQITKRLSGQSNRNFVDNAFFTVNQRGQSTYDFTGVTVDSFYTVDRWWLSDINRTSSLQVNTSGVSATLASDASLRQRYEASFASSKIMGKTITISILLADGTIVSKTAYAPVVSDTTYHAISSDLFLGGNFRLDFAYHASDAQFIILNVSGSSATINVKAAKLELGSVSTLAYDVAPDYAEELLKCQRYYRQYSLIREDGIVYIDPTTNYPHVAKELQNVHMRTTPTATLLTNTGGFIDSAGHAYNPITSVSVTGVTANGFLVDMSTNQATTNTTPADVVSYIYDVVIALSADL